MYTPINSVIFSAAYSGAFAGMVAAGRYISNPLPSDYAALAIVAGAFAQAYDQTWNDAANPTQLEVQSAESIAKATFQDRQPILTAATAEQETWLSLAEAVVAVVHAGEAYFAAQGIVSPAWPTGGGSSSVASFVWKPAGPAAPNVFTTWAAVEAAQLALNSAVYDLFVDTNGGANPAVVPPGASLGNGRWTAAAFDTVTFTGPVTFGGRQSFSCMVVKGNAAAPIIGGGAVTGQVFFESCILQSLTAVPFFQTAGGGVTFVFVSGNSFVGDGVHPVFAVPAGQISAFLTDIVEVSANAFAPSAGAAFLFFDAGIIFDGQPGAGWAFNQRAPSPSYVWGSSGGGANVFVTWNQVQAAIDRLPPGVQYDLQLTGAGPFVIPAGAVRPGNGRWASTLPRKTVLVSDGAVFDTSVPFNLTLDGGVSMESAGATPFTATAGVICRIGLTAGAQLLSQTAAPFVESVSPAVAEVLLAGGLSQMGDGTHPVVDGFVSVVAYGISFIADNSMTGTTGFLSYTSDVENNAFGPVTPPPVGWTVTQSSLSVQTQYNPNPPTNWVAPPPKNDASALDRIAALLVTLNAGSPIP